MNVDPKKLSIILAAVSAYEADTEYRADKPANLDAKTAASWRIQGAVEMMNMRCKVQLRFLKSSR